MSDPYFGPPFVLHDEWRDIPHRHRYVHGGFEGTETLFSFYFPEPHEYRGRFVQYLEGGYAGHVNLVASGETPAGPDTNILQNTMSIEFAAGVGAYLVESNQGHVAERGSIATMDPTIPGYRASAAVARYGRELAAEMYGGETPRGYLIGGSGGGVRTLLALENTEGIWDGGVPIVCGVFGAGINLLSLVADMRATFGPKWSAWLDACAPGSDVDPMTLLDPEQRELAEALYRSGVPRGGEHALITGANDLAMSLQGLESSPYVEEFWSKPGFRGADGLLADELVEQKATVTRVVTAAELRSMLGKDDDPFIAGVLAGGFDAGADPSEFRPDDGVLGVVLDGIDSARLRGARLNVISGAAAGRENYCLGAVGDVAVGQLAFYFRPATPDLRGVAVGDEIAVDNRVMLAFRSLWRYPEADASGALHMPVTGKFTGKMIQINHAHDTTVVPGVGVAYARRVAEAGGADRYRLWWINRGTHAPIFMMIPGSPPLPAARYIETDAATRGLLHLIAWVEDGVEPPASKACVFDDAHFALTPGPDTGGIQPDVTVSVNGSTRAEVKAGTPITLEVVADAPGTDVISSIRWDVEGMGTFEHLQDGVDGDASHVERAFTYTYDRPGTYFASAKVESKPVEGPAAGDHPISNLEMVRVVVS